MLPDSEIEQENLVESKHHRLARSARAVDTELKPDTAALRNRLNEITEYLPTQNLTAEEQDLVWRYRFYLAANKRALTKFVKCINWQVNYLITCQILGLYVFRISTSLKQTRNRLNHF